MPDYTCWTCQQLQPLCLPPVGAKLWAGVEELMELLETALREGPGKEDYQPPSYIRPKPKPKKQP